MREAIKDKNRLEHILETCNILLDRKGKDSLDDLMNDPIKFYGYVKLVEIIGEATYKLTNEYRDSHPNIPWKMMEGMRHVLVHEYYRISPQKLWATINTDIPDLKDMLEEAIREYPES